MHETKLGRFVYALPFVLLMSEFVQEALAQKVGIVRNLEPAGRSIATAIGALVIYTSLELAWGTIRRSKISTSIGGKPTWPYQVVALVFALGLLVLTWPLTLGIVVSLVLLTAGWRRYGKEKGQPVTGQGSRTTLHRVLLTVVWTFAWIAVLYLGFAPSLTKQQ